MRALPFRRLRGGRFTLRVTNFEHFYLGRSYSKTVAPCGATPIEDFNVAFGNRTPHGTTFVSAACDYILIEVLGSRDKEKGLQTTFEGFFSLSLPLD